MWILYQNFILESYYESMKTIYLNNSIYLLCQIVLLYNFLIKELRTVIFVSSTVYLYWLYIRIWTNVYYRYLKLWGLYIYNCLENGNQQFIIIVINEVVVPFNLWSGFCVKPCNIIYIYNICIQELDLSLIIINRSSEHA